MPKDELTMAKLMRVSEIWRAYTRAVAGLICDQTGYWQLIGSMCDEDIRQLCNGYAEGLHLAAQVLDDLDNAMGYELCQVCDPTSTSEEVQQ